MMRLFEVEHTLEFSVYALVEPGTEHTSDPYIRYVGLTEGNLGARLSRHVADARAGRTGNEALASWINGLLKRKRRPVILPLETCASRTAASMAEMHHIARCSRFHANLLNLVGNALRVQAPEFLEDAVREAGFNAKTNWTPTRMTKVLNKALKMMRGNRSAVCATYYLRDGRFRVAKLRAC